MQLPTIGLTDSNVITKTKISPIVRLSYFLSHGAPCARFRTGEVHNNHETITTVDKRILGPRPQWPDTQKDKMAMLKMKRCFVMYLLQ